MYDLVQFDYVEHNLYTKWQYLLYLVWTDNRTLAEFNWTVLHGVEWKWHTSKTISKRMRNSFSDLYKNRKSFKKIFFVSIFNVCSSSR